MIRQFVDALRKEIRKDMNNYTNDVATGACKSFEDYQKLCGVIQGLALAESHMLALLSKVDNDNE